MISQRYSETPTLHVFFSDIRLFPFQFVVEVSFFPLSSQMTYVYVPIQT